MADYDYSHESALIVVDVQNDFAHPSGGLFVEGGPAVVDAVNIEIRHALEAGALVVYTQDWHPPDTPHFEKDGGVWPVHCVRDTWGAAFHDRLRVEGPVAQKGVDGGDGYSGFSVRHPQSGDVHATALAGMLREHGVRKAAIAGLATDYCVIETAIDAVSEGFETAVLRHAIAAVNLQPGDGDRALQRMHEAGVELV
jgi:nicotinamidase/pyrazinamidase